MRSRATSDQCQNRKQETRALQLAVNESATQGLSWADCYARGYGAETAASWMGTDADTAIKQLGREAAKARSADVRPSNWPYHAIANGARVDDAARWDTGQSFAHLPTV